MTSFAGRLLLLASWLSLAAAGGAVVELTDENFDKETATGVWMIKVGQSSHCNCRACGVGGSGGFLGPVPSMASPSKTAARLAVSDGAERALTREE